MQTIEKPAVKATIDKRYDNAILKTIYERRSVRKYKDKAVEKIIIEQLLDAGRMAPSAINKQPWKFYVLTNKEDIKAFSGEISKAAIKGVVRSGIKGIIKTGKDFLHFSHGTNFLKAEDPIFHGAAVIIFITSPKDNEWAALDIGMCSQNIMLAAKSIGLDSCPVGLGKFVEQTKIYSRLNVPESEHVNLAIILGYGDESPEVKERNKNNLIYVGG
jgi:nitroreductase